MTGATLPTPKSILAGFSLFENIDETALGRIQERLGEVELAAGDHLCRQGEPASSMYLVRSGLLEVWQESAHGKALVRRLRPGEIVGEMALLTGEPRSASVIASVDASLLEVDAETFAAISAEHPRILHSIALALIEREHAASRVRQRPGRAEAVALIVGESARAFAPAAVAAAERSSLSPPAVVDLAGLLEPARNRHAMADLATLLARLDALLHEADRVLILAPAEAAQAATLLRHVDRAVLLATAAEAERLAGEAASGLKVELFLVNQGGSRTVPAGFEVVRSATLPLSARDTGWLGRHIARAKLGLALGAGGAKGFAHVGAFGVLEEAGYTFDYVAGSSIGSILGSAIAMGMSGGELAEAAAWLLSVDVCGTYFRLLEGAPGEPGHQRFYDALSKLAGDRRFDDLPIALAIMTADLNAKKPYVFDSGRLVDALHAALSIPGLAPPFERPNQRLVDGVTISPVPTGVLREMGADITVSVNLMSRRELERWPEEKPTPSLEKRRSKTLDPIVETLIMLQTDTSMRNAAEADVVISPMFAPSSWRDIHLADRFEAAGRRAAAGQLEALRALAAPTRPPGP